MRELMPLAEKIGAALKARKQTVTVAESAAGGLISAALLAVPGASAYFVSGAVVYTGAARGALAGIALEEMQAAKIRPASEPYAALLARRMRERLETTWGLAEAGAAGPTGNRYGDPAGHTCVAVSGPSDKTATLRTSSSDRHANMHAFAVRALELFAEQIGAK